MMPDERLRQAVILAGGRGTRLAPLTDTMPKPMIPFHGRPFLAYLVDMLREQGFERVLILLGYLPDLVTTHFGDGSAYGVAITYRISSVDDETGTRLRNARELLDDRFLLLYCDNYWPMDFDRLWAQWQKTKCLALVTVYENSDRYTRNNMIVDRDGMVTAYDKSRTLQNLNGVDIGFFIMAREVIDLIPENGNPSFEQSVYPQLIAQRQMTAFITKHRYYSVGSHQRLPITEAFLAPQKMVLIDRDGTLNKRMPTAQYVCNWDQWEWLPGAREALAELTAAGYTVAIITNQPGLARGSLSEVSLNDIHRRMIEDVEVAGGHIEHIYICPHDWDEGCDCRKPRPGMLFQAQRDFHLDLTHTYFIGDDTRDGEAAKAAGARFIRVSENFPLTAAAAQVIRSSALKFEELN